MTNSFDGHRIYWGFPDSTLQAQLDEVAALERKLKAIEPQSHVTYFPMEEKWQAHIYGKPLSGMMNSKRLAIESALAKARGEAK